MKTMFKGKVFLVVEAERLPCGTPRCVAEAGPACAGWGFAACNGVVVPYCTRGPFEGKVFLDSGVAVGDEFCGETTTGRVIKNAAVLALGDLPSTGRPAFHARWEDENGKHYEWFEQDEFVHFQFI